jgi:hypothetical protein
MCREREVYSGGGVVGGMGGSTCSWPWGDDGGFEGFCYAADQKDSQGSLTTKPNSGVVKTEIYEKWWNVMGQISRHVSRAFGRLNKS